MGRLHGLRCAGLAVPPHQVEQAQKLLLAGGDLACLVGEVVEARPDGKALVLR